MLVECFPEIPSARGSQGIFAGIQVVKKEPPILTGNQGAKFIAAGDRRNGYLGPSQGRVAGGIHHHAADLPFFFFCRWGSGSVLLLRDRSQSKQADTSKVKDARHHGVILLFVSNQPLHWTCHWQKA